VANDPETAEELAEQVEHLLGEANDIRAFLGRRGYQLGEERLVQDVRRIVWGLEHRIEQLTEEKLPYRQREQVPLDATPRPVYGEPDFSEELTEEDEPFEPPKLVAGWDFAWGARLTLRGEGEDIDLTLSISDDVQRNGICARTVTREQLGQFAANLLRIVNGDAPSHHQRWQKMLEEAGIGAILDAPVQFWYCREHDKGIVEWRGNVAYCMTDECTNNSAKAMEGKENGS
jgi:hypothetical protein